MCAGFSSPASHCMGDSGFGRAGCFKPASLHGLLGEARMTPRGGEQVLSGLPGPALHCIAWVIQGPSLLAAQVLHHTDCKGGSGAGKGVHSGIPSPASHCMGDSKAGLAGCGTAASHCIGGSGAGKGVQAGCPDPALCRMGDVRAGLAGCATRASLCIGGTGAGKRVHAGCPDLALCRLGESGHVSGVGFAACQSIR